MDANHLEELMALTFVTGVIVWLTNLVLNALFRKWRDNP